MLRVAVEAGIAAISRQGRAKCQLCVPAVEMNGGSYRLKQSRARRRKGGNQAGSDPAHGMEISGIDDR